MAFNDIEITEYFEPQELYHFRIDTLNMYYTSGDSDIIFNGKTYLPIPIRRGNMQSTQDTGKTTLKITISRRNTFTQAFILTSPSIIIPVTVTRLHANDPDPAVTFKGRVLNVAFSDEKAVITCQSNQSVLKRPGLRRVYQTACPHVLYGSGCKVIRNSFRTIAIITGIEGLTLVSPDFIIGLDPLFDARWFIGGYVEILVGGIKNIRFITDYDRNAGVITINIPFYGVPVGSEALVFAGCDRSKVTCQGKFSNINNYGGFPFIPQKNPMDGTTIF